LPYLYGDLQAEECAGVEQHISECESCRQDLEMLRTAHDFYKAIPDPPGAGQAADRFISGLQDSLVTITVSASGKKPSVLTRFWKPALAGTLIFACAVMAFVLLLGRPDASGPAAEPGAGSSMAASDRPQPSGTGEPVVEEPINAGQAAGDVKVKHAVQRKPKRSEPPLRSGDIASNSHSISENETRNNQVTPVSLAPKFTESVIETELHTMRRRVNSLVRYINNDDF
jgi:hypothetical protein